MSTTAGPGAATDKLPPHIGRYRVIAHAIGRDLDVTHEVVLEVTT